MSKLYRCIFGVAVVSNLLAQEVRAIAGMQEVLRLPRKEQKQQDRERPYVSNRHYLLVVMQSESKGRWQTKCKGTGNIAQP